MATEDFPILLAFSESQYAASGGICSEISGGISLYGERYGYLKLKHGCLPMA
jgi:hypothetical protein